MEDRGAWRLFWPARVQAEWARTYRFQPTTSDQCSTRAPLHLEFSAETNEGSGKPIRGALLHRTLHHRTLLRQTLSRQTLEEKVRDKTHRDILRLQGLDALGYVAVIDIAAVNFHEILEC